MVHSTSSFGGSTKTTAMKVTQRIATTLNAALQRPRLHGVFAGSAYSPRRRRGFPQFR